MAPRGIWDTRPGLRELLRECAAKEMKPPAIRDLIKERFELTITTSTIWQQLRRMESSWPAICAEAAAEAEAERARPVAKAEPVASPVPPTQDLHERIRALLRKEAITEVEIADRLDVAPKRVREALAALADSGYRLATQGEGAAPAFMIAPNAPGDARPLEIDTEKFYDGHRVRFGLVSDTHLGSKYYREEVLQALYDRFEREGLSLVFHGGNWIEGEKTHNRFELLCRPGLQGQIDYFVERYPQRKGLTTYLVAGDDHEGWYQQREGIDIGRFMEMEARKAGRDDLVNLGYLESNVAFRCADGASKLRVVHAGGGSAYALSYAPQKLIESLDGGDKPHMLAIGHYHKAEYLFYRNVHCVQMGATKAQDTFMRKLRLASHIGGWIVSAVLAQDGTVLEFSPTFLPFLNRAAYESMAIDPEDARVAFRGPNPDYGIVVK